MNYDIKTLEETHKRIVVLLVCNIAVGWIVCLKLGIDDTKSNIILKQSCICIWTLRAIGECIWHNDSFTWRTILSWISNSYIIWATTVDTWFSNRPDIIYLKYTFSVILISREQRTRNCSTQIVSKAMCIRNSCWINASPLTWASMPSLKLFKNISTEIYRDMRNHLDKKPRRN